MCSRYSLGYALDLSDTASDIERFLDNEENISPYFRNMYENGRVFPMGLTTNYEGYKFAHEVGLGFLKFTEEEGPFYIHCVEGKDRTGFVCVLLLALAGASLEEITDDYMLSYDNYYGINKLSDPEKYEVIVKHKAEDFYKAISKKNGTDEITAENVMRGSEKYLEEGGLTKDEIKRIKEAITE